MKSGRWQVVSGYLRLGENDTFMFVYVNFDVLVWLILALMGGY